jgi:hypothetical protein
VFNGLFSSVLDSIVFIWSEMKGFVDLLVISGFTGMELETGSGFPLLLSGHRVFLDSACAHLPEELLSSFAVIMFP